jgi:hypothetical protein
LKRSLPAIGLFFLAPLIAEFLLGDLPITFLPALIVLAPMYGGGALLIREVTRRTRRGWPTILVLALAYAIFEEAFTTQTLFNPNYLHLNLHLLEPAYIPALGISVWWTLFVLTLHTVWSISVSIALAEALTPARATEPWLGAIGLTVTALLFALGAAASTGTTLKQDPFHASIAQFVWSAVFCLAAIAAAFLLPRGAESRVHAIAPTPWLPGAAALIAGSVFITAPKEWGWSAVAIYLVLDAAMIALVSRWSRSDGWGALHRLALAGGAALAYAWHAFIQAPAVGKADAVDRVGNAVFAAGLIVLLSVAARRNSGKTLKPLANARGSGA